jgi:hypothetical protein
MKRLETLLDIAGHAFGEIGLAELFGQQGFKLSCQHDGAL